VNITILAYIDDDAASELNLRPPRLECTLILHIALGQDYFIVVNGDYRTLNALSVTYSHSEVCRVHVLRKYLGAAYTPAWANQKVVWPR